MRTLATDRPMLDSRTDKGRDLLNELVETQKEERSLCLLDMLPQNLLKGGAERRSRSLNSAGRDLEDLLVAGFKPSAAERQTFHDNVGRLINGSLSIEEKQRCLQGLREILSSGNTVFTTDERARIACQALQQAANPAQLSQGDNRTCSVTSLENVLYRTRPSAVIEVLRQAVKTGTFKTMDKTVVEPDKESLKADAEAKKHPTGDGERSYASQMFQIFAVNIYWSRQTKGPDGSAVPRGKIQYRHNHDDGKDVLDECLLDTSHTPPVVLKASDGAPCRSPKLGVQQLPDIYKEITGLQPGVLCLKHGDHSSSSKGVKTVSSQDELERFLEANKNRPLIIKVDSKLLTEKKVSPRDEPTPGHDVVITGYDSTTRRVLIDNSWSNKSDHLGKRGHGKSLSIEALFKSMNPPWGFKKDSD